MGQHIVNAGSLEQVLGEFGPDEAGDFASVARLAVVFPTSWNGSRFDDMRRWGDGSISKGSDKNCEGDRSPFAVAAREVWKGLLSLSDLETMNVLQLSAVCVASDVSLPTGPARPTAPRPCFGGGIWACAVGNDSLARIHRRDSGVGGQAGMTDRGPGRQGSDADAMDDPGLGCHAKGALLARR